MFYVKPATSLFKHVGFSLFQLSVYVRAPNRNLQAGLSGGTLLPPCPSISMKHKVENRYQGSDSDGMSFAVSQTPLVEQLQQSQPAALCQALFNFNPAEMNLEDSGSFLSFHKVGITNCILTYCLPLGGGGGCGRNF